MVSTIVPIAGKPVTSLWPAAVATEPKTFRLLLDADARLAAAAGGVARYLADAAGFESDAVARLQSAVIAACLEVALSHLGEDSPAIGLDTIAGFASHIGATGSMRAVFAGFDRVQYETHDGEGVTRLTKYIGHVTPGI
jgi:hypothetical protein